jgi:hypothetical protein
MIKRLSLVSVLALVICVPFGVGPQVARACDSVDQHQFGLSPGCLDIDVAGAPTPGNLAPGYFQAGGHPYAVTISVRLNAPAEEDPIHGAFWPPESVRDLDLVLPPGMIADPAAVPPCSVEELLGSGGLSACPPDSQVGVVNLFAQDSIFGVLEEIEMPFFRVGATASGAARFGFNSAGSTSIFEASLLSGGDGAVAIELDQLSAALPLVGMDVTLWGVPADPGHTPDRACPGQVPPAGSILSGPGPTCPATLPPRAFLRLPTTCTGPATVAVKLDSWSHPGVFEAASVIVHRPPGLRGDPASGEYPAPFPGLGAEGWGGPQAFEGCGDLPFEPAIEVRPSSSAADSPTGLDIEVALPQRGLNEPDEVGESDLREAVIDLPAGLSINAAAADGLGSCTAAEVDLESAAAPSCPGSSKLGTVEIVSPLLEAALTGSIYVAQPPPGASAATLSAYVVAAGEGTVVKLPAALDLDPTDGRISATLANLPQIPIAHFRLHFFDGDRAAFITPATCGSYAVTGQFSPWSGGRPVVATSHFPISAGAGGRTCADRTSEEPFTPGFVAGVESPAAGRSSSFTMRLTREDGEQEPTALELSLPSGLTASLRGVAICPDATIDAYGGQAGTMSAGCPEGSRIGDASLALGAGAEPIHLPTGRLYLAGPYQGSAFSFVLVVSAAVGPIDLGTVALRLPLSVDPADGGLSIGGDLPTTAAGTPLSLREIALDIDRPGFVINPTGCRPASIGAEVEGDGGARVSVSSPFQVVGCGALRFRPRLRTAVLGGVKATRHAAHPGMRFVLTGRGGEANLKRVEIAMSGSEQLDPTRLRGICERAQFAVGDCPRNSVYGHARVVSPNLEEPLTGPVYLRTSGGKLPSLVASLGGALQLQLEAKLEFAGGRVRIAIDSLPDLPVSKLVLTTLGGRRGLLVNDRDLCGAPSFSNATLVAQSGRRLRRWIAMGVKCG